MFLVAGHFFASGTRPLSLELCGSHLPFTLALPWVPTFIEPRLVANKRKDLVSIAN
jgi:hypothetical protein